MNCLLPTVLAPWAVEHWGLWITILNTEIRALIRSPG